jgi:hypothetical protein
MIAAALFWTAIGLVLYAYFGYPCALLALRPWRRRSVRKQPLAATCPAVSFIITAYNEERRIRRKIEDTLAQDYPADRFEVIVASDCSTDGTDDAVRAFGDRVRLVRAPERRGKEAAQQLAIRVARGDLLVFSDVATMLEANGLSGLVRSFADPTVGCVSSIDRFIDTDGRRSGEGAYVRYEMRLRRLETEFNTLVGLSGSFFAARREVCTPWRDDRQSDFNTLLNAVRMGLRGVLDDETAGYYEDIADGRREQQRKIRTIVRGLAVLRDNLQLLNPARYGLFAWQLASHKLCRWLVPFALIAALTSNAVLAGRSVFYAAALFGQVMFYAAALIGWQTAAAALRIPSFLLLSNLSILIAWYRFARGERVTHWNPSERAMRGNALLAFKGDKP